MWDILFSTYTHIFLQKWTQTMHDTLPSSVFTEQFLQPSLFEGYKVTSSRVKSRDIVWQYCYLFQPSRLDLHMFSNFCFYYCKYWYFSWDENYSNIAGSQGTVPFRVPGKALSCCSSWNCRHQGYGENMGFLRKCLLSSSPFLF